MQRSLLVTLCFAALVLSGCASDAHESELIAPTTTTAQVGLAEAEEPNATLNDTRAIQVFRETYDMSVGRLITPATTIYDPREENCLDFSGSMEIVTLYGEATWESSGPNTDSFAMIAVIPGGIYREHVQGGSPLNHTFLDVPETSGNIVLGMDDDDNGGAYLHPIQMEVELRYYGDAPPEVTLSSCQL